MDWATTRSDQWLDGRKAQGQHEDEGSHLAEALRLFHKIEEEGMDQCVREGRPKGRGAAHDCCTRCKSVT